MHESRNRSVRTNGRRVLLSPACEVGEEAAEVPALGDLEPERVEPRQHQAHVRVAEPATQAGVTQGSESV